MHLEKLRLTICKTTIRRGSRVLVMRRRTEDSRWSIQEGVVKDAQGDCLLVEFRWWFIAWRRWVKANDVNQEVRLCRD
jgi:hypothetical protein